MSNWFTISSWIAHYILAVDPISTSDPRNIREHRNSKTTYFITTKMRRISRIERSTDLLRVRASSRTPNPYLCYACKQRQSSFSTSSLRAATNAPGFTEKLRRKIWGTDNPPGAKDPYGGLSKFEKTKQREQEQELEPREDRRPVSQEISADYQPADSWNGLEVVGDTAVMFRQQWEAEHQFEGFLPSHVMNDPAEITANVRRAIIEVLAQRQAGQSSDLPSAEYAEDLTRNVKLGYSEAGLTLDFGTQENFEYLIQSLAPAENELGEHEVPTDAEEEVAAERSTEDPLKNNNSESENGARQALTETSATSYEEVVEKWDASWLQIPLDNAEVKFAVDSSRAHIRKNYTNTAGRY